ncbi:SH3 domain-containing protein [Bacillus sp. WLY-B-L8]|uniref:SH3 domain-containing protein n=1 Tax=Bacillus multifaciens TaxID=3068506 RepID=UPI0027428CFB|nr:SH3 domain-containing protein [Bacillus sp. WLY-B-L8]MDP7980631.1 SH3 domain-containing protein [Bacillus sp. WLY-B-L8]
MNYVVIQKYRTNYPNPISLVQGQSFIIGDKYNGPEKWDNWYFCITVDKNSSGWVPAQLIQWKGTEGIAKGNYTAKELNVDEDEHLVGLKELNGWIWQRVLTLEKGWVPKENVKLTI